MIVFGHCGAQAYAPENTLEAFRLSFDMHSDGVETDLRMTADGEVICIHDGDTFMSSGVKADVHTSTLEELKKIPVPRTFKKEYPDVRIPTLRELFALMKEYPGSIADLELKDEGEAFLGRVLEVTDECGMNDRVFYSMFSLDSLEWFKTNRPDIKTALLCVDEYTAGKAAELGCFAVHPHYRHVDSEYVKDAHERGVKVNVWTLDDPDVMIEMRDLGVDGVITDRPDTAVKTLV